MSTEEDSPKSLLTPTMRIFMHMQKLLSDPQELTERGTLARPALKQLQLLCESGIRLQAPYSKLSSDSRRKS